MNEFKYTGEIEEDEDEDRIPEVRQNQLSEKFTIGVAVAIAIWIFVFMILESIGVIPAWVMRVCVYPVVGLVLVAYGIIKYRNNRL